MRIFIVFHSKSNTTPRLSNYCGGPFFSLIVLSPFTVRLLLHWLGYVPKIGRWVISGPRNHSAVPAGPKQSLFSNQIINPKISVEWNNRHSLLLMSNILFPSLTICVQAADLVSSILLLNWVYNFWSVYRATDRLIKPNHKTTKPLHCDDTSFRKLIVSLNHWNQWHETLLPCNVGV